MRACVWCSSGRLRTSSSPLRLRLRLRFGPDGPGTEQVIPQPPKLYLVFDYMDYDLKQCLDTRTTPAARSENPPPPWPLPQPP